jgi:hypothetical protein
MKADRGLEQQKPADALREPQKPEAAALRKKGEKMVSQPKITGTEGKKILLSTLWLFAVLNYLYCDVMTLMDSGFLKQILAGQAGAIPLTQGFLSGAAILMEIPIAMVALSRLLAFRANRWANVLAGGIMTVVQSMSLFAGTPTPYYAFFSAVEILTTAVIFWQAWRWNPSPAEV